MQAHNTFEKPETVHVTEFGGWRVSGNSLTLTLPAKSVITIQMG